MTLSYSDQHDNAGQKYSRNDCFILLSKFSFFVLDIILSEVIISQKLQENWAQHRQLSLATALTPS